MDKYSCKDKREIRVSLDTSKGMFVKPKIMKLSWQICTALSSVMP